jgi:alanyl-tRNA synthetase
MKSHEVRKKFLDYFEKQKHTVIASSSLIPEGDSTLIFTNAGMFQFKNVFLGVDKRPYNRAVSSQKCVRAGGKHNDLENVGYTARHHTFFEMLGNFSFGDYFKKEAIHFAWEFLTKELSIPKEKLYVTVFREDDEAEEIWHKQEGVAKNRIYRFDEKDNFWKMGDTGPCGPCTEMFYDHFPERGECKSKEEFIKGCDEDRFIEIWNLVFMQFYEEPKGTLTPLPKPSVDTGAGLERIVAAMQGTNNNYESDLFSDYIAKLESWTGIIGKKDNEALTAMRVMSDHARCVTFLISDGVLPSNEGRGYVLRRILRRAIRYGRKLSIDSLMPKLCQEVIVKMGDAYPELRKQKDLVIHTIQNEEERFLKTLDQGTQLLQTELDTIKKQGAKTLAGAVVFKLYDTYGFPADLTALIAKEQGFTIDETGFETCMEEAREKARKTWKGAVISSDAAHLLGVAQSVGPTIFEGYTTTSSVGKILKLSDGKNEVKSLKAGQNGFLFLDKTCFYAESGGQVGDLGSIEAKGVHAQVTNTTKVDKAHVLQVSVQDGSLEQGTEINMTVAQSQRRLTAANHSATHLLHSALRKVLGSHVTQAGSLVEPDRLRFDFTHNKPMTLDELEQIETLVNREISLARPVGTSHKSYDQAIKDGAMALFGEKYDSDVRVIQMGDFSTELCGGTHVENTAQIRLFKIVSETGVSAGVRRMEALTSDGAFSYLLKNTRENQNLRRELGIKESWTQYTEKSESMQESAAALDKLRDQLKTAEKDLKALQLQQIPYADLVKSAATIHGKKVVTHHIDIDDRKLLTEVAERLRDHLQSGVVVLTGRSSENFPILICVTKDLAPAVNAGNILKNLTTSLGGKGGGRPDFAQGGINTVDRLNAALAEAIT